MLRLKWTTKSRGQFTVVKVIASSGVDADKDKREFAILDAHQRQVGTLMDFKSAVEELDRLSRETNRG
jgi:hypothetical protein